MTQPFSRVFCVPDVAQRDSVRLRSRLGRQASTSPEAFFIAARIEIETGARVPYVGVHLSLDRFFQTAELRDVLDAITHIYAAMLAKAHESRNRHPEAAEWATRANGWRSFVRRVLAEEHTTYQIDDECHVQYAVDEAYALGRRATLLGLSADKWAASRGEFERAFERMDSDIQDTTGAVRAIAASVESCAKTVMAAGVSQVGVTELERYLWPIIQNVYAGDDVSSSSSHEMLKSLGKWINSTHSYRHGQDGMNEVEVPLELAVQFLSAGAGFLRWLIAVDVRRYELNC